MQAQLSRAILASLNKPPVREAIEKLGFSLNLRDAEQLRTYQAAEIKVWQDIVAAAGIKPE